MLPVEVRILPTFEVVARLGMLNSYSGLIDPLDRVSDGDLPVPAVVPGGTRTSWPRRRASTVPGPMRFFWDILLPLSRTNIAALFVILFIFGWNQYLWPLMITSDPEIMTVVVGITRMLAVGDDQAEWQLVMATAMLAMIPPVLVVVLMQRLFVKGLVETEK